jgi:hypothetical protein
VPCNDTRQPFYACDSALGLDRSLEDAVSPRLFLVDVAARDDLHLRLYSPTEAWYDKTWRRGEIELVE